MAKVILEFSSPEEDREAERALKAVDLECTLFEFMEELKRSVDKDAEWPLGMVVDLRERVVERVRDRLFQIAEARGVVRFLTGD